MGLLGYNPIATWAGGLRSPAPFFVPRFVLHCTGMGGEGMPRNSEEVETNGTHAEAP